MHICWCVYLEVQADAAETLRSEHPQDRIDAPGDKSYHYKDLDSLSKGTVVVLDLINVCMNVSIYFQCLNTTYKIP